MTLQNAKLTFVRQLIQDINDGTLTEISGEERIWKITHPELTFLVSHMEKAQEQKHTWRPRDEKRKQTQAHAQDDEEQA